MEPEFGLVAARQAAGLGMSGLEMPGEGFCREAVLLPFHLERGDAGIRRAQNGDFETQYGLVPRAGVMA